MKICKYGLRLAGCLSLILCLGCAYVPLTSLWSLSRLSPETLAAMDPAAIRARVTLPETIGLKPEGNVISIALTRQDQVMNSFELPLQVIDTQVTPTGWFDSGDPPRRDFLLTVTEAGQQSLRSLQSGWQEHRDNHDGANIGVVMKLDRANITEPTEFLTSVAVRLEQDGDFIVLFEDMPLTLELEPTEVQKTP